MEENRHVETFMLDLKEVGLKIALNRLFNFGKSDTVYIVLNEYFSSIGIYNHITDSVRKMIRDSIDASEKIRALRTANIANGDENTNQIIEYKDKLNETVDLLGDAINDLTLKVDEKNWNLDKCMECFNTFDDLEVTVTNFFDKCPTELLNSNIIFALIERIFKRYEITEYDYDKFNSIINEILLNKHLDARTNKISELISETSNTIVRKTQRVLFDSKPDIKAKIIKKSYKAMQEIDLENLEIERQIREVRTKFEEEISRLNKQIDENNERKQVLSNELKMVVGP